MRAAFFLLFFQQTSAFFIRSYVSPNAKCNSTIAVSCFLELFSMISEVCAQKEINFRCVHYTFLDECFESRVGKCDATSVARVGAQAYRQAVANCQGNTKEGTQCHLSRTENCTSDHVHNIMNQCELKMKPRNGYSQFDRHRLLRIKMDTSKRLLIYQETDKERECLVSLVTRCLCERMGMRAHCGIDCNRLEPNSPDLDMLTWDDWKNAQLIRSNRSLQFYDPLALSFLYFVYFLFFYKEFWS
ncbi:unnamed protein product [Caenorhabditis auriculariae]|uniref:DUF19 domain-containing protein n=1 Tax=Caenorhabditis auriculariae TaxID=2777116 RepID=A0A8S1H0R8_9PELO|nr:unnamed protein product [Caenorhabditis auriculariae]